jgi:YbbR domain-containing protein
LIDTLQRDINCYQLAQNEVKLAQSNLKKTKDTLTTTLVGKKVKYENEVFYIAGFGLFAGKLAVTLTKPKKDGTKPKVNRDAQYYIDIEAMEFID